MVSTNEVSFDLNTAVSKLINDRFQNQMSKLFEYVDKIVQFITYRVKIYNMKVKLIQNISDEESKNNLKDVLKKELRLYEMVGSSGGQTGDNFSAVYGRLVDAERSLSQMNFSTIPFFDKDGNKIGDIANSQIKAFVADLLGLFKKFDSEFIDLIAINKLQTRALNEDNLSGFMDSWKKENKVNEDFFYFIEKIRNRNETLVVLSQEFDNVNANDLGKISAAGGFGSLLMGGLSIPFQVVHDNFPKTDTKEQALALISITGTVISIGLLATLVGTMAMYIAGTLPKHRGIGNRSEKLAQAMAEYREVRPKKPWWQFW